MTQDEQKAWKSNHFDPTVRAIEERIVNSGREQKALEAGYCAVFKSPEQGVRQCFDAAMRAHNAAMTEGGVWVSKEDAEAFASVKWKSTDKDNMEFSATTTCYVMDKLRPAISRLRAKLEGNHDKND